MKLKLVALGAALAAMSAVPAFADSIDFAQFGAPGTTVANGTSGTTNGGVSYTISATSDGFTEYMEDATSTVPYSWAGEFAKGETILFNDYGVSPVTINFSQAISSLQDVEAQANRGGAYTASIFAYNAMGMLVGSDSYDSYNDVGNPAVEGTIPNLNVYGDITSVMIFTTNDADGFALGGTGGEGNPVPGAPEPATWALMSIGVGLAGYALRRRRSGTFAAA